MQLSVIFTSNLWVKTVFFQCKIMFFSAAVSDVHTRHYLCFRGSAVCVPESFEASGFSSDMSVFIDPFLNVHRSCAVLSQRSDSKDVAAAKSLPFCSCFDPCSLCLAFESAVAPSSRCHVPIWWVWMIPSRPPANKSPSHGMN